MTEPIYRLHRLLKSQRKGATAPHNCRLNAILKRNSADFPYCVYGEQVAVRLAQTLRVPVADGVLTQVDGVIAFASLEVASPAMPLPDLLASQFAAAAERYPREAAGLTLFDILIGNWDRRENLKAAIKTDKVSLFRGFDHSHVLLEAKRTITESLKALQSLDLIVARHPFYGHVKKATLDEWLKKFALVSDEHIQDCCTLGRSFGEVDNNVQQALGQSLGWRKANLAIIIEQNLAVICPEP